jgi:hypothetical protein
MGQVTLSILAAFMVPVAGLVAVNTVLDFEDHARAEMARVPALVVNPNYLMDLRWERSRGISLVPVGGCVSHAS